MNVKCKRAQDQLSFAELRKEISISTRKIVFPQFLVKIRPRPNKLDQLSVVKIVAASKLN